MVFWFHGSPIVPVKDQGSNVDGEVANEMCNTTSILPTILKETDLQNRTCNVKKILRTMLLHRKMDQSK